MRRTDAGAVTYLGPPGDRHHVYSVVYGASMQQMAAVDESHSLGMLQAVTAIAMKP